MIKYFNECVDCGKPCIDSCQYLHSPHYYCDNCGKEIEPRKLFAFLDEIYCPECALQIYEDNDNDNEYKS